MLNGAISATMAKSFTSHPAYRGNSDNKGFGVNDFKKDDFDINKYLAKQGNPAITEIDLMWVLLVEFKDGTYKTLHLNAEILEQFPGTIKK